MYCALDKIDLAATVEGRRIAVQTDHRAADEINRDLALSILFALTRVINARQDIAQVHYIVAQPPPRLAEALAAAGAVVSGSAARLPATEAPAFSEDLVSEIADQCFREVAQRAAAATGARDFALALRMLEDQTHAAPPEQADPARFWRRVIELAALSGELLRARFPSAHWIVSERAMVPFGLSLPLEHATSTIVFPTNRAQRLIEEGRDHSLFELLVAAEETRSLDKQVRLMPSLRLRDGIELEELVWRPLLPEVPRVELPIVVCGIDGESTFGMIRRDALTKPPDEAWEEAFANLAAEDVELAQVIANDVSMLAVSGSFYAAEKLLDPAQLRALHQRLDTPTLLAATPARGGLLVIAAGDADARFAALVREKYDAAGARAISPAVWIVEDGEITGLLRNSGLTRADTGGVRAETSPASPGVQRRRK